jgi:hypothetical protein
VRWHEGALDEVTLDALRVLGPVMTGLGLYLGGGTAVALHLGHRRSRDLDWSSRERMTDVKLLLGAVRHAGVDPTVDSV